MACENLISLLLPLELIILLFCGACKSLNCSLTSFIFSVNVNDNFGTCNSNFCILDLLGVFKLT